MLLRKKNKFNIQLHHIFSFQFKIIKSILYIGIPFAFELLFFYVGNILVQAFIINLGTASVAANAITTSVIGLLTAPGLAVGTLAITVIAQCIGAGERDLAKKYGTKMIWLATSIIILSLMVLLPFMPYILHLYQAPTETLSMIYKLLFISIIPMPIFWSCSNVIPAVLRATGDSTYSSIVSLATMWLIRVGLGYILTIPLGFGVYGFALTAGIEWAVKMIIFLHRYLSGAWLDHNKMNL